MDVLTNLGSMCEQHIQSCDAELEANMKWLESSVLEKKRALTYVPLARTAAQPPAC